MTAATYAQVIAEQAGIRQDHQAARRRRRALRRAQQQCEDLTELLGRLGAAETPAHDAETATAARAAARDLYRLVAGPVPLPAARPPHREPLIPAALDGAVEQLDEVLSDLRAGFRDADRHALRLVTVVAAGVEALTSPTGD
jgi:hypothetical protein